VSLLNSLAYGAGATFRDAASGIRFAAYRPADRPDLWAAYLEGAEECYGRFGLGWVVGRDAVGTGENVSLFWVARDGGRVVAGMRCHGPLPSATDAFALAELAGHPDLAGVVRDIEGRLGDGVVEIKGVWAAADRADHRALSNALARCYVHSMRWFGVRYALSTTGEHALERWMSSGGRPLPDRVAVPYPDHRYRTVRIWWDADRLGATAEPAQLAAVEREARELAITGAPSVPQYRHLSMAHVESSPAAAAAAWQPIVLDPSDPADAAEIERHLADPALVCSDLLPAQQAELHELVPAPSDELLEEGPRWVLYPWRGRMIRILGPRAFDRVRLDRNRNKITLAEQERLRRLRIGVVGLSVGHVIAHTLAMEGLCGELRLGDFDRIELSNLNRIPATLFDVGVNKAHVAARRIAELDPYLAVTVADEGVTGETVDRFVEGLDIVVEECDSLDVKILVREAARRRRIPVIMETSDRGMLDVERFDLEPDRPLFHGLVDDLRAEEIAGLTTHDKVPYVLRILEPAELSARMAASMAEIDETVSTWPQLAGDVTLGGASVAATVRSLGRGEPVPSGRARIDLASVLAGIAQPEVTPLLVHVEPAPAVPHPDDLVELVGLAAGLAPSGGNTQPWRFEGDDDEFRVYLDRDQTSTMDVAFRGSYVACGAALLNARVAAASRGRSGPVALLPDRGDTDLVATLRFGDEIDLPLAELADALWARHSNRHEGDGGPIDPALLATLTREVEAEGARLGELGPDHEHLGDNALERRAVDDGLSVRGEGSLEDRLRVEAHLAERDSCSRPPLRLLAFSVRHRGHDAE